MIYREGEAEQANSKTFRPGAWPVLEAGKGSSDAWHLLHICLCAETKA